MLTAVTALTAAASLAGRLAGWALTGTAAGLAATAGRAVAGEAAVAVRAAEDGACSPEFT